MNFKISPYTKLFTCYMTHDGIICIDLIKN